MTEQEYKYLVEFYGELELLAPADPASTRRALGSIPLSEESVVVDAGCGTGRQTLQLLEESKAPVVAIDLEATLLEKLESKAADLGYTARLTVMTADMLGLPFQPGSVDLIYSEGAIYNVGYEAGLRSWLPLLKPGGYVCVSDAAYTDDDPPEEVRLFWDAQYPGITTASRMEQIAVRCGYEIVDGFWMPNSGWEAYYLPVERRVEELSATWDSSGARKGVLEAIRHEIEVYRRYGDSYGYYFVVLRTSRL